MKISVIGAGNSGLAMAAHMAQEGHRVSLWNRSRETISKLMKTKIIRSEGVISGDIPIDLVTDRIEEVLRDPELILVTTPASSHRELARLIGENIRKESLIVLNPGRTFGALEFKEIYAGHNKINQTIAETQTIIYTCRKTDDDAVSVISLKNHVLISAINEDNQKTIDRLPEALRDYFIPARSMIETSIGNVGMILHSAPLILNSGWTESIKHIYKYYYDGITPTIGRFIEKIDGERLEVARLLGLEVESTKDWMVRTYDTHGDSLYECIQNNRAYKTIDAPESLNHRYIFEDIPCGLVPLESVGKKLGLAMTNTTIIIDLASSLMEKDFRATGRTLENLFGGRDIDIRNYFRKGDLND